MRPATSISAFICDRANYGRLLPLLWGLRSDSRYELKLILGGSFVVERFGSACNMLESHQLGPDNGVPCERVYHEIEGDRLISKALSIGAGVSGYAQALERQACDWALVIGDRYEALAAAQAAVYTGRCLVHVQGGEVSGTLDESARHAITKLAHYHLPATFRAMENILLMGEPIDSILAVGCPSADLARRLGEPKRTSDFRECLVVFHPDGPDPGREFAELLAAVFDFYWDRVNIWWPNIDAGNHAIVRELQNVRQRRQVTTIANETPMRFLQRLRDATVCVGNSSSFVRDAGYFGTPVVLVGHRQDGRERGEHVQQVEAESPAIRMAIGDQLAHGPYPPSELYGRGYITKLFLDQLANRPHVIQKRLSYGTKDRPPTAVAADQAA